MSESLSMGDLQFRCSTVNTFLQLKSWLKYGKADSEFNKIETSVEGQLVFRLSDLPNLFKEHQFRHMLSKESDGCGYLYFAFLEANLKDIIKFIHYYHDYTKGLRVKPPIINWHNLGESNCLYIGKTRDFDKRFRNHLRFGAKGIPSSSIQLISIAEHFSNYFPNMVIIIKYLLFPHISDPLLQDIERMFFDKYHSLLGRCN